MNTHIQFLPIFELLMRCDKPSLDLGISSQSCWQIVGFIPYQDLIITAIFIITVWSGHAQQNISCHRMFLKLKHRQH